MRPGRPSKLTEDRKRRLLDLLRNAVYPEVAAQSVGVGKSTYYEWMAKGRADRAEAARHAAEVNELLTLGLEVEPVPSEYTEFLEAVEQALADPLDRTFAGRLHHVAQNLHPTREEAQLRAPTASNQSEPSRSTAGAVRSGLTDARSETGFASGFRTGPEPY